MGLTCLHPKTLVFLPEERKTGMESKDRSTAQITARRPYPDHPRPAADYASTRQIAKDSASVPLPSLSKATAHAKGVLHAFSNRPSGRSGRRLPARTNPHGRFRPAVTTAC